MKRALIQLIAVASLTATGCIDAGTLGEMLGDDGALDEATVAAGLREALEIGNQQGAGHGITHGRTLTDRERWRGQTTPRLANHASTRSMRRTRATISFQNSRS